MVVRDDPAMKAMVVRFLGIYVPQGIQAVPTMSLGVPVIPVRKKAPVRPVPKGPWFRTTHSWVDCLGCTGSMVTTYLNSLVVLHRPVASKSIEQSRPVVQSHIHLSPMSCLSKEHVASDVAGESLWPTCFFLLEFHVVPLCPLRLLPLCFVQMKFLV